MRNFKLLQINTQKSYNILAGLLSSSEFSSFQVVAIQEPWTNRTRAATHCPAQCTFYQAFPGEGGRSCFLINKAICTDSWSVRFPQEDYALLRINSQTGVLWIHNIYNPPVGDVKEGYISPILSLRTNLAQEGSHIVIGDFNLHHPQWNGRYNRTTNPPLARTLLDTTHEFGLTLTTPPGLGTWRRVIREVERRTTIDLCFCSTNLSEALICCRLREDLDFGSDHLPIESSFSLRACTEEVVDRFNWNKADVTEVRANLALLLPFQGLRLGGQANPKEIEEYVDYLLQQILSTRDLLVPKGKPPGPRTTQWWSPEIQELVRKERRLRRVQDPRVDDIRKEKKKAIRQAKAIYFRQAVHDAACGPEGVWKLSKWCRTNGTQPAPLPAMPELRSGEAVARTNEEKVPILKKRFYPEDIDIDLANVPDTSFQESSFRTPYLPIKGTVSYEEVDSIMKAWKKRSAPGYDGIPNSFLKQGGKPVQLALASLTEACWAAGYFPARFRQARTVVIRKPRKESYEEAGSWRPIALLCSIGKVIEALTARRIRDVAEEHLLLPPLQMGNRQGRSTESALEVLTESVRTAWKNKTGVLSLLSLDISGAFDTVNHTRLLHVLREKGFPYLFVRFIKSFLTDRSTSLVLQKWESSTFQIQNGVPQGSPLSPILFLLYTADLPGEIERGSRGVTALSFADDTNLLSYGTSTTQTCRQLETAHTRCLAWARRFGMRFAPQKYSLVHFSRTNSQQELKRTASCGDVIVQPTKNARVLGVIVDQKLTWAAHARMLRTKMETQVTGLTSVAASTWGAPLLRSRQVYLAVVRAACAYGAVAWFSPTDKRINQVRKVAEKTQRKCLRTVTGAYKATSTRTLEREAYCPPIDLFITKRVIDFHSRLKGSPLEGTISALRIKIQRYAASTTNVPLQSKVTPYEERQTWIDRNLGQESTSGWLLHQWLSLWREHSAARTNRQPYEGPPERKGLRIHKTLRKAESSVLIQLRSRKAGFNDFLFRAGVPGRTKDCPCGAPRETVPHVLLICPLEDARRTQAFGEERPSLSQMLFDPDWIPRTTRWIIQSGRLPQFSLASSLLYK